MTATIQDILSSVAARTHATDAPPKPRPAAGACAPDCDICHGSGLVRYDVPPGHELFGRILPCPNLPKPSRHVLTPCGLYLDDIDRITWDSIRPEPVTIRIGGGDPLPATAATVADAVRHFLRRQGMVYLCGNWGIGKTLILAAAIAERARAHEPAQYVILADILEDIKAGFDQTDPRQSARERIERWRHHPFLAIDEMDKVQDTEWVRSTLFRLLDTRYEMGVHEYATTLIASNEPPEALDRALASRIRDGRCLVVEMQGEDVRPRMAR